MSAMFETHVADRIATVTLCRAPVNALSAELKKKIEEKWKKELA